MPLAHPPNMPPAGAWTIVVPFKGGTTAKSRLGRGSAEHPRIGSDARHRLALAFLRDTVAAAAAVSDVAHILVVSPDPALATAIPDTTLVADPGGGLNAAVTAGIDRARAMTPDGPVAVLTGDLPCLVPRDLATALDLAARHPLALVPDRHGTGTTMITALPGIPVTPHFGAWSCQAHIRSGHAVLPVPATSTLRADVDTLGDLDQALHQGVGRHTRSAIPQPMSPVSAGRSVHREQLGPVPAAI